MLVEIALVSSFILMGSNLVGVATSSYNSGSWDGKSPVTFFEVVATTRSNTQSLRNP